MPLSQHGPLLLLAHQAQSLLYSIYRVVFKQDAWGFDVSEGRRSAAFVPFLLQFYTEWTALRLKHSVRTEWTLKPRKVAPDVFLVVCKVKLDVKPSRCIP